MSIWPDHWNLYSSLQGSGSRCKMICYDSMSHQNDDIFLRYKFLAWCLYRVIRSCKIIKYFKPCSMWTSWFSWCCLAIKRSAKDCNHWRCGGWLWSLAETCLAVRCQFVRPLNFSWIFFWSRKQHSNILDRLFGQWLTYCLLIFGCILFYTFTFLLYQGQHLRKKNDVNHHPVGTDSELQRSWHHELSRFWAS